MGAVPLVRVVRSGFEESLHLGHVAACDDKGALLAHAGDASRPVFARSSMKPLQAAVSLQATGDDELSDAEVAVMCASHNGEPIHVETVRRILDRAGLDSALLRCPPSWPLDEETMGGVTRPRSELHNCSGKHAGMLLACVRREWDLHTYREPDHPLQARVMEAVLSATGLAEVAVGVDGCGVPVHGMPLSAMATLYARLARPDGLDELAPSARRATAAMLAEPYLVAGRGRVDTAVMAQTGDIVVKVGAEGLICAAAMGPGIGVAVKVADGSGRAAGPSLIRALRLLELLDEAHATALESHAHPAVLGGGEPVGRLEPTFQLHRR